MKNDTIAEIKELILDYDKFLVTGHIGPDGDSIGSILALKLALEQLGKVVEVVIADELPDCFSFLSSSTSIKEYDTELEVDFDLVFVLDCGTWDRIAEVEELVDEQIIVNLDHHSDNTYFGDYNFVKEVAATAELIYHLIEVTPQLDLNQDIATAIITALITDTGSFRYSNTTSRTHQIAAQLLEYDVDTAYISRQIFGTNSYENLKLRGQLLRNLQVDKSGKIAWMKISQELLDDVGTTLDDTAGIVNYPRSLEGAEVGLLFKEQASQEIKVSLRSNSYLPVNEVAHKFGGGGHARAAGCLIEDTLEQAEEKIITALAKALEKYSATV
ncbi:exopolyphosphatase-like enzyme [Halobacteroides halobius DSM 5150]|uniref:Exopolyphosphatase-like enzyme n=1 Tax=Halobacteroides halobius (strain ATCC 35273 / DSM 5150 / MD-1) TaxID=748449 RepID=L0K983_HALHC|nr:bifunctional oligoribonuclease/PAP phosphatase NrnA [Halobacteroides halobius]AGB40678.1 exopolyphosphatase-like enzyme [Halobacteroides halobius DSM 5150]